MAIINPESSLKPSMVLTITTTTTSESDEEHDLEWPFGKVDIDEDGLRETAYEILFTSCRSSPGFGGRTPLAYMSSSVPEPAEGQKLPTSRIKRQLGLQAKKASSSKRLLVNAGVTAMPSTPPKVKRPFTTAELMRQQMRISEQSDSRLRKALMRILVGQMGRRSETIILPMELLRQLKPSEFNDPDQYHQWQKRHLRILEIGLLQHPFVPLDRSNPDAQKLKEILSTGSPIDTSKNSETMKLLCNAVIGLAWRTSNGNSTSDICHWVDGYPLNIHIYLSLLQSIFDIKDETFVIEEIDEILELIKKTWTSLGINKLVHNVCFTWILFQQFVLTGQTEGGLLEAALAMLSEITSDAKKATGEALYIKMLLSALTSMQTWAEKWLLDYHSNYRKGPEIVLMESVLPLALSAATILDQDFVKARFPPEKDKPNSTSSRVESYIHSSISKAFDRILENKTLNSMASEGEDGATEFLMMLAREVRALAKREKENFSPVLKKWHPVSAGVAAVTLHNCYGAVMKQHFSKFSTLTKEAIKVLQIAGDLEKFLAQTVVDDSADSDDGGKRIIQEIVPFESESIILSLLKIWVEGKLRAVGDNMIKARETEIWNPKSKAEPYAQSALELERLTKEIVDEFFEMPVKVNNELVQNLADGLEGLFQDYAMFVSSCGTKQSFMPTLPPLTRCNQDSKLLKVVMKATACNATEHHSPSAFQHCPSSSGGDSVPPPLSTSHYPPRPSTTRSTQRLYIRLNTLYNLLAHLHSLHASLCRNTPQLSTNKTSSHYFDLARATIYSASQHVAEVAAYRLVFLDSNAVFYDGLYAEGVSEARIRPVVRSLKQNLTLLSAILCDRARETAIKEIMKASFEAFLMVLLAGGQSRAFDKDDIQMIKEDFGLLKQLFVMCGGETMREDAVEREAEEVKGVLELMEEPTERLVEDFTVAACEASGLGLGGGQKVPMPPTTGRWNRADPNTILRVLCHRNDKGASVFLKKTFQLPRRR